MALSLFGATAAVLASDYFPHSGGFNTATKPTEAAVGRAIDRSAAELAGKLAAQGVTAATISGAPSTYPAAYAWCAETVLLGTAVRVSQAMLQADPEQAKAWAAQLKARFEALEEEGSDALGDAPAGDDSASGVSTHISANGLETDDADDMSDCVPRFRRSDEL